MQLTTVLSSILLMGGLAAAAPVAEVAADECVESIICIDAINSCGIRYGGCYDVCKVSAKPKPPPCPPTSTIKPTTTPKPTTTKKPTTTAKSTTRVRPTTTRKTTTITTKPTPTKKTTTTKRTLTTSKVRPTTSTKKTTTTTTTPKPTTTWRPTPTSLSTVKPLQTSSGTCNGSGLLVCWDAINACGQMYGACFADCKPWPTPSAPPCLIPTSAPVPTLTPLPILTISRG